MLSNDKLLQAIKDRDIEKDVNSKAEFSWKTKTNAKDKYESTPLWLSVINNHIEIAQLLIKHGADVNSLSSNSKKPLLCHAIEWSSSEMVELLIQKGADINAQGQYDKTPLQCAIEKYNEKKLFQCLLYGANVSAEDRNTINSKPKIASCLAEFEKIKVKPQSGTLIEACRNRNKDIILDEKALAKEIQEIKEHYSSDKQLSFIPKCLDNFINHFTPKSVKEKRAQSFLAFPPESSLADTSKIVENVDASASKSR